MKNKLSVFISIIALALSFTFVACGGDDPVAPTTDDASSSSSSVSSSSSAASSSGSGYTFNAASPIYYSNALPTGWLSGTHFGTFGYTANFAYTTDKPASSTSVIRLTRLSDAWSGLWINGSDSGSLNLNTLSTKSLKFDFKGPDAINVKFENSGTIFAAGWFGGSGIWEAVSIPISTFITTNGGQTYWAGAFNPAAVSALVFVENHTTTAGQDYLIANIRIE